VFCVLGVGVFRLYAFFDVLVWVWGWVRGCFLNSAQLLEYVRKKKKTVTGY